jgi:transcriptional antiterminator
VINKREYIAEIEQLKKDGKLFPFEQITKEQLRKLWHEEYASDNYISDLFGVSKYTVTNKRKKMGLTLKRCVMEDILKQFNVELALDKTNSQYDFIRSLMKGE